MRVAHSDHASQAAVRCSSLRFLDTVPLFLPSQRHSTAAPSLERYGKRYEVEGRTNFLELRKAEVRRMRLPRTTPVNKGKNEGRDSSRIESRPSENSRGARRDHASFYGRAPPTAKPARTARRSAAPPR